MSYVHESSTDQALAELEKMAAIDKAGEGRGRAVRECWPRWANILLEAGRVDEAAAKFGERSAALDRLRRDAPRSRRPRAARPSSTSPGWPWPERHAAARAKAAAYAKAVAVKSIPFEVRQSHELAGRIALAGEELRVGRQRAAPGQPAGPSSRRPDRRRPPGSGRPAGGEGGEPRGRRLQRPFEHLLLRAGQGPGPDDGDGSELTAQACRAGRPSVALDFDMSATTATLSTRSSVTVTRSGLSSTTVVRGQPAAGCPRGHRPDDRRHPEQPQLRERPAAHEQRRRRCCAPDSPTCS